jgi:hypothetical protein
MKADALWLRVVDSIEGSRASRAHFQVLRVGGSFGGALFGRPVAFLRFEADLRFSFFGF